jgi:hypothetical protein
MIEFVKVVKMYQIYKYEMDMYVFVECDDIIDGAMCLTKMFSDSCYYKHILTTESVSDFERDYCEGENIDGYYNASYNDWGKSVGK